MEGGVDERKKTMVDSSQRDTDSRIRILAVDDHEIVRQGLCSLIENEVGMVVIGEAGDGETAMELACELEPDVIVMDVSMPGIDGIDTTRRIVGAVPCVKIVALSLYPRKSFIVEMLRAGALGYVLKDNSFDELAKAINTVMTGKVHLCPKAAGIIVDDYVLYPSGRISSEVELTQRQREILKMLAEGKPSKEVALILDIGTKTVDACRRRIMQKLNIQSIPELVKYAIRQGLTSLDS